MVDKFKEQNKFLKTIFYFAKFGLSFEIIC